MRGGRTKWNRKIEAIKGGSGKKRRKKWGKAAEQ